MRAAIEHLLRQQPRPESEEERRIKDPATDPDERFRLQTNQVLRQSWEQSQQAQRTAQDAVDAANFQMMCLNDPIARKYAPKVEAARQQFIAKGATSPPRDALLTFILGQEVRNRAKGGAGKGKAAAAGSPAPGPTQVPRGKLPNARSDAGGKGAQTERDKRRARLENQPI